MFNLILHLEKQNCIICGGTFVFRGFFAWCPIRILIFLRKLRVARFNNEFVLQEK